MRTLLLFLGVLSATMAFGQASAPDPGAAAEKMKIDAINQRIRMQQVPSSDKDGTPIAGRRINLVELQQKTDELNKLVKSLDGDMVNLRKGVLAADLDQRLKKIEKLAKEIRRSLE